MAQPLDYHIPPPRRSPAIGAHIRITIAAGAAWLVLMILLTLVVPRVEVILQDFRAELPPYTRFVLVISRFMVNGGWLYSLVLPIAVIGFGLLIDAMSSTGKGTRLYARLVSLLLTILVALTILGFFAALYAPLVSLIEAIQ